MKFIFPVANCNMPCDTGFANRGEGNGYFLLR